MRRFSSIAMFLGFALSSMLAGAAHTISQLQASGSTFHVDYEGECPYCKLPIAFDAAGGSVIHRLPMCTAFEELEPDFFAKYVRLRMEGRDDEAAELLHFS